MKKLLFGGSKPRKVTPKDEIGATIEDDVLTSTDTQEPVAPTRPSRDVLRAQQRPPSISVDDPRDDKASIASQPDTQRWHVQALGSFVSPTPRSTSMPKNAAIAAPLTSPYPRDRERDREVLHTANTLRKKPPVKQGQAPMKSSQNSVPAASVLRAQDHPTENTRNRSKMLNEEFLGPLDSSYEVVPMSRERTGGLGRRDREIEKDHYPDREKPRHREYWPDYEDKELTRMIGFLTSTSSEDWTVVLEISEKASATDAGAKEAVKALRREFKYGEPPAQLSAARLWALMLRNSSDNFVTHVASRKFLDTLQEVIMASKTSPVVRERLKDVLAAAAFAWPDKPAFRNLWRKLKSKEQPDEGIPFDPEDPMLNPPALGSLSPTTPMTATLNNPQHPRSDRPRRPRKIITPEEDRAAISDACQIACGNAQLLSDALAYAQPKDLGTDLIREFISKCNRSHKLVQEQIPWATANADKSRMERASKFVPSPKPKGEKGVVPEKKLVAQTPEEDLLALLLSANEALVEALNLKNDLERVGIERDAEEISRLDIKMDQRMSQKMLGQGSSGASVGIAPNHNREASQRLQLESVSRSPSPNSVLSYSSPATNAQHPQSSAPPNDLVSPSPAHNLLARPPPPPQGPRSPAIQSTPSRTSSPVQPRHLHSQSQSSLGSNTSSRPSTPRLNGMQRFHSSHPDSSSDESDESTAPIKPSAKALGKRRVVDADDEENFNTDEMFYEKVPEPNGQQGEGLEFDSDSSTNMTRNKPMQYAYDAAAERTKARITRGRVSTIAHSSTVVGAVQ